MKIKWEEPPEPNSQEKLHDRFWGKVDFEHECWVWAGTLRKDGYGVFWDRKLVRAHRWSYQAEVGPILEGLVLDHLCRISRCVNPHHLEAVTDRINVLRGVGPAAVHAKQTVCKRGHDDWYQRPSGGRQCRTCARAQQPRYETTRRQKAVRNASKVEASE